MSESSPRRLVWFHSILLISGSVVIGNFISREQHIALAISYGAMFTGYLCLWNQSAQKEILWTGIFARLVLFISLPTLSDDLFRFIWDGHLLHQGVSPYAELPGYYLKHPEEGLTPELYDRLNSKSYFTIYPPINQLIFWLATIVDNWILSAGILRGILLAADIGSYWLLRKLFIRSGRERLANLYFLNPLIILEGVGNVHFEVLVIFLLVSLIWFSINNKFLAAGATLGLAHRDQTAASDFFALFLFPGFGLEEPSFYANDTCGDSDHTPPFVGFSFCGGYEEQPVSLFPKF